MRLIDKDKLIEYMESIYDEHKAEAKQDECDDPFICGEASAMHNFLEAIKKQPTVTVSKREHAHWVELGVGYPDIYKCSKCGKLLMIPDVGKEPKYCPYCGSEMDEVVK